MKRFAFALEITALTFLPSIGSAQPQNFPPAQAKPLYEIVKGIEDQGYKPIASVDFDDGRWEVEAYKEGKKLEIKLDPVSGAVQSVQPD